MEITRKRAGATSKRKHKNLLISTAWRFCHLLAATAVVVLLSPSFRVTIGALMGLYLSTRILRLLSALAGVPLYVSISVVFLLRSHSFGAFLTLLLVLLVLLLAENLAETHEQS